MQSRVSNFRRLIAQRFPQAKSILPYVFPLLSIIPLIMLIVYVKDRAQIVPWLDEWSSSYPLVRNLYQGTLSLSQLARFNVDHRILFPNILTIIFARTSHWNAWFDITFSIVISTFSVVLIYDIYRRQNSAKYTSFMLIPLSLLILSLGQRENWIWGFQKQIFLVTFLVCVAAWALNAFPKTLRAYLICLISAWLGSWSFASGNLLWLILPLGLWMNGYRNWRYFLIWILSAILSFSLYAQGMPTSRIATIPQIVSNLFFLRYELAFLGAPFNDQVNHLGSWSGITTLSTRSATFFGLLGIVLAGMNLAYYLISRKGNLRQLNPWMILGIYGLANGLLLSLGRSAELSRALIARYATLSLPFWVALVAIMISNLSHAYAKLSKTERIHFLLLISNFVAFIFLCAGYLSNLNQAYAAKTYRDEVADCMLSKLHSSERCLLSGFFRWSSNQETVSKGITFLADNDLSIFANEDHEVSYSLQEYPIFEIGPQTASEFRMYSVEGESEVVLFQHAPSTIELRLEILDVDQKVSFLSAAYLDPRNVFQNPEVSQDGVNFQIHLRDESGVESLVFNTPIDPHTNHAPVPISIDLSAYVGQVIRIILDTDALQNPHYDWSMWVNPRIEMSGED